MSSSILVAFASKYGSTQQVAETVAAELRNSGATVTLEKARDVKTLEGYSAIVLGAPIYSGAWHKDALNLLLRHRRELEKRPVAIFALGPTHDDEEERKESRAMLKNELAKLPWLVPVTAELFGGRYDPGKLRFHDTLIASLPASPLHGVPASDVRDWAAIRAWATSLVAKFQPALAESGLK